MSINANSTDSSIHLEIDGEMTIYTALEQKNDLAAYLSEGKDIQIDLSGVSEIDSAGTQLLLFVKQEAAAKEIPLTLTHHSEAVVEVVDLYNLASRLGDDIILSADWKSK